MEKPQPALPGFVAVNVTPNKDYKHIPAADFTEQIQKIYEDTIKWRKNTFLLPSGQAGKDFINDNLPKYFHGSINTSAEVFMTFLRYLRQNICKIPWFYAIR